MLPVAILTEEWQPGLWKIAEKIDGRMLQQVNTQEIFTKVQNVDPLTWFVIASVWSGSHEMTSYEVYRGIHREIW